MITTFLRPEADAGAGVGAALRAGAAAAFFVLVEARGFTLAVTAFAGVAGAAAFAAMTVPGTGMVFLGCSHAERAKSEKVTSAAR